MLYSEYDAAHRQQLWSAPWRCLLWAHFQAGITAFAVSDRHTTFRIARGGVVRILRYAFPAVVTASTSSTGYGNSCGANCSL